MKSRTRPPLLIRDRVALLQRLGAAIIGLQYQAEVRAAAATRAKAAADDLAGELREEKLARMSFESDTKKIVEAAEQDSALPGRPSHPLLQRLAKALGNIRDRVGVQDARAKKADAMAALQNLRAERAEKEASQLRRGLDHIVNWVLKYASHFVGATEMKEGYLEGADAIRKGEPRKLVIDADAPSPLDVGKGGALDSRASAAALPPSLSENGRDD